MASDISYDESLLYQSTDERRRKLRKLKIFQSKGAAAKEGNSLHEIAIKLMNIIVIIKNQF
jgi:hypothetical protein